MTGDPDPTLRGLRTRLRTARRELGSEAQANAGRSVARRFIEDVGERVLEDPAVIGSYVADDGEVPTGPIEELVSAGGGRIVHPLLDGEILRFAEGPPWKVNRYGIPEPGGEPVAASELCVVLVPLVGFDRDLNRLGRGGGYYDKTFGELRARGVGPLLVGLGHDVQEVPALVPQSHDVALDLVITPTRTILRR